MTMLIMLLAVGCLAYANGANDNFKGVATLFGSGTTDYQGALAWATVTTLLGSLTAVVLAGQLLKAFSGKGLVDGDLVGSADYAAAVALGAGLAVLFATRLGLPVSTTHGLIGALVGAGVAAGSPIRFSQLSGGFVTPLLISPILAVLLTGVCYPAFRWIRSRLGITEETCLCAGRETLEVVAGSSYAAALRRAEVLSVRIGDVVTCRKQYTGRLLGIEAATALDRSHFLSAGAVSFARGLNDTPKIAALLLLAPQSSGLASVALVGALIAAGGLTSARRVATTMSNRITSMNHGQGFTANLITGLIVIGASRFGLPVSTTHVSCGSLFGIGVITRQAHWRVIGQVLLAWVTTLPLGAALGAVCYGLISAV